MLAGMCLIDTTDGALMLSLYVQPATNFLPPTPTAETQPESGLPIEQPSENTPLPHTTSNSDQNGDANPALTDITNSGNNGRDPVAFLYYSIVLTSLTVMVALVIGILQVLSLVLNVRDLTGPFWRGVQTANDYYDAIGGGICGCFVIVGLLSVVCYKPWRRWVGIDASHGKGDADIERQANRIGDKGALDKDEEKSAPAESITFKRM